MKVRVTIVGAALIALAGGVAYATIPDGQGVIHACYKTENGQLRVVDDAACSASETPLSWSQTGPQGPPGPPGAAGVLGFYVKHDTLDLAPQSEQFAGLDCLSGDNATGSGYEPVGPEVQVAQNAPTNGLVDGTLIPHGWHFAFINASDSSKEVQISVVCADLP